MKSRSVFVKARKYYKKICCNKYVINITQLNELNEYVRNHLENIPTRTISHGLTHKRALSRIAFLFLLFLETE